MDYNKLKIFTLVAKHGQVSTVAGILRRSQPAVTQQIQSLEQELGFRLLEGRRGKTTLTPQGQQIYAKTKTWFDGLDDDLGQIVHAQGEPRGRLRIVALGDGGNRLPLPAMLARFSTLYPGITVDLDVGTNGSIERDLLDEKYDIGFTVIFAEPKQFQRWPMSQDLHDLYTSPVYKQQIGGIAACSDLCDLMLIDLSDRYLSLAPWMKKNAPKVLPRLFKRPPSLVVRDYRVVADILSSGRGVAMLPQYLAETRGAKTFVKVFEGTKATTSGLDMAIRRHKTPSRCEELFIDFFREEAAAGV